MRCFWNVDGVHYSSAQRRFTGEELAIAQPCESLVTFLWQITRDIYHAPLTVTPFCAAGLSPIPVQIDLRVQKTLQKEFLLSTLQITAHNILNNPYKLSPVIVQPIYLMEVAFPGGTSVLRLQLKLYICFQIVNFLKSLIIYVINNNC